MRRALGLLGWALLLATGVAWALLLRPTSLGGPVTYVLIRGDSMLPAYQPGDVVIVRADADYAVGDVVAFRVPDGEIGDGQLVIHRLVSRDGGEFVAQGDNNPFSDPWSAERDRIVGRAWFAIPGAGRAIAYLAQPVIAGGLAMAVVVALCLARPPASGPRRRRVTCGHALSHHDSARRQDRHRHPHTG